MLLLLLSMAVQGMVDQCLKYYGVKFARRPVQLRSLALSYCKTPLILDDKKMNF